MDNNILAKIIGDEEEVKHFEDLGSEIIIENLATNSFQKLPEPRKRLSENKSAMHRRKNRKVLLLKCAHDGDHFEKCYIEESIELSQISVVMNCQTDSIIWSFCGFPEIDGKICCNYVICTICKSIFTYDGSTSGAKRHVEGKHKQVVAEIKHMSNVEPGQVLVVGEYGDSALPMRLVCESDVVEPQLAMESSTFADPLTAAEPVESVAETRCVRITVGSDDSDEPKTINYVRSRSSRSKNEKESPEHLDSFKFNSTQCLICDVDFKNVALAMMHRSAHGSKEDFSCAQCGKVSDNRFDFWGHLYKRSCT